MIFDKIYESTHRNSLSQDCRSHIFVHYKSLGFFSNSLSISIHRWDFVEFISSVFDVFRSIEELSINHVALRTTNIEHWTLMKWNSPNLDYILLTMSMNLYMQMVWKPQSNLEVFRVIYFIWTFSFFWIWFYYM